jgi:hypothetical protein
MLNSLLNQTKNKAKIPIERMMENLGQVILITGNKASLDVGGSFRL